MTIETEIRTAADAKKLLIGAKSVTKKLKFGQLSKVIISSDCPDSMKTTLEQDAKLAGIPLEVWRGSSTELGAICRKPFTAAVVGIAAASAKKKI